MSEGPRYHQRSTDNLVLEDPFSFSSLQSLMLPQTLSHILLSRGTALFISLVHLPTRLASLPNCTSPEPSFS